MAHSEDFGYIPVTLVNYSWESPDGPCGTVLGWLPGPLPVGSRKTALHRLTGLPERVGLPHTPLLSKRAKRLADSLLISVQFVGPRKRANLAEKLPD